MCHHKYFIRPRGVRIRVVRVVDLESLAPHHCVVESRQETYPYNVGGVNQVPARA